MFRPILRRCFMQKHKQDCLFTIHRNSCKGHEQNPEASESNKSESHKLVRRMEPGKVRMGFIPDEWFTFFYQKTGVTGPYLFGGLLLNYCLSKEIYVMEHEFYSGLSVALIVITATKQLGPAAAKALDKMVEEYESEFNNVFSANLKELEDNISHLKESQASAMGQSLLMEAKKENIRMQLEAYYRERFMLVYITVKHRMDYHAKRYLTEARIHQKWMAAWILREVHASINADFKRKAMESALSTLSSISTK